MPTTTIESTPVHLDVGQTVRSRSYSGANQAYLTTIAFADQPGTLVIESTTDGTWATVTSRETEANVSSELTTAVLDEEHTFRSSWTNTGERATTMFELKSDWQHAEQFGQ